METKKSTTLQLSIHGDTFNAFKTDFDSVLRALIGMMISKGSENAKITAKFNVSLAKDTAPDTQVTEYEAMRDVVLPKIEHKITSAISIKDEREGYIGGGNYELVFDDDEGWVLRPIKDDINLLDLVEEAEDEADDGTD
jgi:hypothetical protein